MPEALLSRRPHTPPPALTLGDDLVLPLSRVHEICGGARRTLALEIAAQAGGPVVWITPAWAPDPLNPDGIAPILEPGEIIFITPRRVEDMLWTMEETLRAGVVPVAVAELPEPPALTPVRRLHLAAEAGTAQGMCRPLGLILTPEDGGAAGIETRHRIEAAHRPNTERWRIERLRARMAPPHAWHRTAGEKSCKDFSAETCEVSAP